MLLDDTQQCIYFGCGQVITYDYFDELRKKGHNCRLYRNLSRQLQQYDCMVEDTGIKLFELRRITDVRYSM